MFLVNAQLHGCDIKDIPKTTKQSDKSEMLFRNPKEYENMTDEEKAALTLKMKRFYKNFAATSQLTEEPQLRKAQQNGRLNNPEII